MNVKNNLLLFLFGAIALGGIFYLQQITGYEYTTAVQMLWGIDVLLKCIPLIIEKKVHGKVDWLTPPIFSIVTSILGIFRPIFIISDHWKTEWLHGGPEFVAPLVIRTLLLAIIADLCFLFTYYGPIGLLLARRGRKLPILWNKKKLYYAAFFFIVLGFFSFFYLIVTSNGIVNFITHIGFRRWLLKGKNYPLAAALDIPLGIWLIWGHRLVSGNKNKFPILVVMVLLASVLMVSTLGGRGFILQIIIVSFVMYYYLYKRSNVFVLLVLAVVVSYFLAIYQDLRSSTVMESKMNLNVVSKKRDFIQTVFNSTTGFDRTMVVIEGVPDKIGYQYFATYTRIVTSAIPRKLWPGKPALTEAAVYAPLFGMWGKTEIIGVYPAGSIGDFYLQLGVVGVIIGFFLIGVWQRFCYEYMLKQSKNPTAVLLYAFAMTSGVFTLRNLGIVAFLIRIFPLLLIVLYIRVKPKRKSVYSGAVLNAKYPS